MTSELNAPGAPVASQSGTGHQHRAPAIAVIEFIQCRHEPTAIDDQLIFSVQGQLTLLETVTVQFLQHDTCLGIFETGTVYGPQTRQCCRHQHDGSGSTKVQIACPILGTTLGGLDLNEMCDFGQESARQSRLTGKDQPAPHGKQEKDD